jgi:hypothetical protein
MENIVKLQNKIETMISGEKKRREVAIMWLQEISILLEKIGIDLWGNDIEDVDSGTITISSSGLYFRYIRHCTKDGLNMEETGFYVNDSEYNIWGKDLVEIKGKPFWQYIGKVMEYTIKLSEKIEIEEKKRSELLKKLNID